MLLKHLRVSIIDTNNEAIWPYIKSKSTPGGTPFLNNDHMDAIVYRLNFTYTSTDISCTYFMDSFLCDFPKGTVMVHDNKTYTLDHFTYDFPLHQRLLPDVKFKFPTTQISIGIVEYNQKITKILHDYWIKKWPISVDSLLSSAYTKTYSVIINRYQSEDNTISRGYILLDAIVKIADDVTKLQKQMENFSVTIVNNNVFEKHKDT